MYIVPEDDPGSVSLCVNINVNIMLFEPFTFIIETAHKFPAEAEGKSIGYISIYNHIIILNQILTLQVELTCNSKNMPSSGLSLIHARSNIP